MNFQRGPGLGSEGAGAEHRARPKTEGAAFGRRPVRHRGGRTAAGVGRWGLVRERDPSLPAAVLDKYHSMGIRRLFQWQVDALRTGGALVGGNLVYSAPTSAGKTLVAELLVLKRVLETKKAIFILPYVAVSREKVVSLDAMYGQAGLKVGGFMGSYSHSPPGGFAAVDVAFCTIEKANSLINRLVEEKRADEVSCVVVDEMHMVRSRRIFFSLNLLLSEPSSL